MMEKRKFYETLNTMLPPGKDLNVEQQAEIMREIRAGTAGEMKKNKLALSVQALIRKLAISFKKSYPRVSEEDLNLDGEVALAKCMDPNKGFDPDNPYKATFVTFVKQAVTNEMIKTVGAENLVKIPRDVATRINVLEEAISFLHQNLGKKPSPEELANYLKSLCQNKLLLAKYYFTQIMDELKTGGQSHQKEEVLKIMHVRGVDIVEEKELGRLSGKECATLYLGGFLDREEDLVDRIKKLLLDSKARRTSSLDKSIRSAEKITLGELIQDPTSGEEQEIERIESERKIKKLRNVLGKNFDIDIVKEIPEKILELVQSLEKPTLRNKYLYLKYLEYFFKSQNPTVEDFAIQFSFPKGEKHKGAEIKVTRERARQVIRKIDGFIRASMFTEDKVNRILDLLNIQPPLTKLEREMLVFYYLKAYKEYGKVFEKFNPTGERYAVKLAKLGDFPFKGVNKLRNRIQDIEKVFEKKLIEQEQQERK